MSKRVKPIIFILVGAAVCVAILYAAFSLMGYTYTTNSSGAHFLGRVSDGQPISGTIKYPTGETAELDYANHTISYSNGSVYVGDIVGINRHGTGTMTYKDTGDVYTGTFADDKISGYGTYTYSNGDVYTGNIKDGKYNGLGVIKFIDGSTYDGSFENGVKSGYGKYTWKEDENGNQAMYEGYFADDVKSGQGTMHYANGDVYKGGFLNDRRSGEGVYTWADGERYEGNFLFNLIDTRLLDDKGNFISQGDGSYVHGDEGVYTFATGKSYTGFFEEGKVIGLESGIRGTNNT